MGSPRRNKLKEASKEPDDTLKLADGTWGIHLDMDGMMAADWVATTLNEHLRDLRTFSADLDLRKIRRPSQAFTNCGPDT